jgi:hypothetical protein
MPWVQTLLPLKEEEAHCLSIIFQYATCFFISFLFFVLGFELRALHLPGRCSTTWAILPTLFIFRIFLFVFLNWVSHLCPGWPRLWSSYLCFLCRLGWKAHDTMPRYVSRWGRELFCSDWPWTTILLISTSQVARITDKSQHAQL